MDGQTNAHKPRFGKKAKRKIQHNEQRMMQRMKANAAALRIIYWVSKQMIGID